MVDKVVYHFGGHWSIKEVSAREGKEVAGREQFVM